MLFQYFKLSKMFFLGQAFHKCLVKDDRCKVYYCVHMVSEGSEGVCGVNGVSRDGGLTVTQVCGVNGVSKDGGLTATQVKPLSTLLLPSRTHFHELHPSKCFVKGSLSYRTEMNKIQSF